MGTPPLHVHPCQLFPGEVSHPRVSGHSVPEIRPLLGTDWPGHWDRPSVSSCFLSPSPWALGREQSLGEGGACTKVQVGWGRSEPMGELRAEAKAQEAASLEPHLVPISSPCPSTTLQDLQDIMSPCLPLMQCYHLPGQLPHLLTGLPASMCVLCDLFSLQPPEPSCLSETQTTDLLGFNPLEWPQCHSE